MRKPFLRRSPRTVLASCLLLTGLLLSGCASHPPAAEVPPFELSVSLDRAGYRIGEPVIAAVRFENKSEDVVELARFDAQSVQFMAGLKGPEIRVRREPVSSAEVAPEPRRIVPGQAVSREFLFTRLSEKPGEYALMANCRGIVVDGRPMDDVVFAPPVAFTVGDEVALRRDPVSVLLRTRLPDGSEKSYAFQVNPYTGKTAPLELQGAGEKLGVEPAGESPGAGGGGNVVKEEAH
jgi:hypothetical protein